MVVDESQRYQTADLLAAWQSLIGRHSAESGKTDVGRQLLARWSEPHRRYHNVTHLRKVLRHVDQLADHAATPDAVRLAAWYHDAVYTGFSDDEQNSAALAEKDLADLNVAPALVIEVARLVRLTASHKPDSGDRNGEVLCDADLAVLASAAQSYAAYAEAIRAEYARVSEKEFRLGRSQVLRSLLDGPALYRTGPAHARWEAAARVNLKTELERLNSTAQSVQADSRRNQRCC